MWQTVHARRLRPRAAPAGRALDRDVSRGRVEAETAEEAIRGVLGSRSLRATRCSRGGSPTTSPSSTRWRRRADSGSRDGAAERRVEELVLVGRADRDADRVRRAEPGQRPDDHALEEQALEQRGRVLAEIDVEEVADGAGGGLEAVALQDRRGARSGPAAFRARRRAISSASSRLASAAACAVVVRSNGRRTFAIAAQTSCGPTA